MDSQRLSQLSLSNTKISSLERTIIQQEIDCRVDAIQELRTRIETLESERQAYQALLTPLRCIDIPNEIMGEIFLLTISDTAPEEIPDQVLDICCVCKFWRAIALATPRLWSTLAIETTEALPVDWDIVQRWFDRSGCVPKTLWLSGAPEGEHFDLGRDPMTCPFRSARLAKFVAGINLFDHLSLSCATTQCLHHFIIGLVLPTTKGQTFPSVPIRSLELKAKVWRRGVPGPASLQEHYFNYIPTVSSLSLLLPYRFERALEEQFHFIPTPILNNLTTFYLECDWEKSWVMKTLEECVNVEDLTLDFHQMGGYSAETHPSATVKSQVILPKVRSLRLRQVTTDGEGTETDFLKHLTLPALEEIDISWENQVDEVSEDPYPPDEPWLNIIKFVAASKRGPHIKRLRVHYVKVPSITLVELLELLPSIEHLTLDSVDCDLDGFMFWVKPETQDRLLSRLQVLEILNAPPSFHLKDASDLIDYFGKEMRKLVVTVAEDRGRMGELSESCVLDLRAQGVETSVTRVLGLSCPWDD